MRQRIRSSGFPYVKTPSNLDRSLQPCVPRAKIKELAALRLVVLLENTAFTGISKTYLVTASRANPWAHTAGSRLSSPSTASTPRSRAARTECPSEGGPYGEIDNRNALH